MSQWLASQPQRSVRPYYPVRESARRFEAAPPPQQPAPRRNGYTFVHAGRQVRLGPVAFWIAVGTIVIMAGWSLTTATYFAFRDDVLKGLMARQAAQQDAYEDRIAELRAQIDRTTSRQLLDQDQFEQKLNELMHRQTVLESRTAALNGIADPTVTGAIGPLPRGAYRGAYNVPVRAKPSPLDDSVAAPQPPERGKQSSVPGRLSYIEASLDRVARRQIAALDQMEDRYASKARLLRSVLAQLGIKRGLEPNGSGGPFVPVKMPPLSQPFERTLTKVSIARADVDQLDNELLTIPVRKPVTGPIDISSPFGIRIDPFLHVAGMHTGMDFRGAMGEPIHATAAGTVTVASWSGGYGKMVEINHGHGLATRYGHLSEIDVVVGQPVRAGQVVGRLGSTGRSTGPHMHYETRVNGEPVNPEKFLGAGDRLFGDEQIISRAGHGEVQD